MLSWLFLLVLTLLSLCLGVLQYRWVGEVSRAERERLHGSLESSLNRLALEFNTEMTGACAALMGAGPEPDPKLREEQYASRYAHWKESARHEGMVRGVWLAKAQGGAVGLRVLNFGQGSFEPAEWPASWQPIRERIGMSLAEG